MTRPRLRHSLPAGVIDAGFNSLATFAAGLTAARLLSPDDLGVYAVFFTAFVLGMVLPRNLVLLPARVVAVSYEPADRLGLLGPTLRLGTIPALFSGLAIGLAALMTRGTASLSILVALLVTATAATFLASLQEHARGMLHLADASWRAAATSVIHLVSAIAALLFLASIDIERAWIPFGSLAIGYMVSLAAALVLAKARKLDAHDDRLHIRSLARSGRSLLLAEVAPTGGAFVSALLIASLAGSDVLGLAEAARIAAQPVLVLAFGIGAVIGPRSMEAGARRDPATARHVARVLQVSVVAVAAVYALWTGFDWPGNPMSHLLPQAYTVSGLVAVTVLANVVLAVITPLKSELIGGRREKWLAKVESAAAPLAVLLAATAAITRAFARPLGLIASQTALAIGFQRGLQRLYTTEGIAADGFEHLSKQG